ncbi:MAG: prepilin-type N-terminal cleavage/methylation domain-containing protein, partial [Campylobacter sp.]
MKKAFTMIELVIVIVVIGIIAMVTIPKYDQNRV